MKWRWGEKRRVSGDATGRDCLFYGFSFNRPWVFFGFVRLAPEEPQTKLVDGGEHHG